MSTWKTVKLSDIGTIVGGATPATSHDEYYNGDIPWLTPKDLQEDILVVANETLAARGWKVVPQKYCRKIAFFFHQERRLAISLLLKTIFAQIKALKASYQMIRLTIYFYIIY